MAGPDSDAVYRIKKNIGYAKFFLKVGKRSDAQDRLRKSLDIILESSRGMPTMTDEIRQFIGFTEEINSLWKESKETHDPPGSSFLLAMGDMVFLATPGGGMSVVNLDPDRKTKSTVKPSIGSSPARTVTPVTPVTPQVPVNPQGQKGPRGFLDRFNPWSGSSNDKEEERKRLELEKQRQEAEERQRKEEAAAAAASAAAASAAADRQRQEAADRQRQEAADRQRQQKDIDPKESEAPDIDPPTVIEEGDSFVFSGTEVYDKDPSPDVPLSGQVEHTMVQISRKDPEKRKPEYIKAFTNITSDIYNKTDNGLNDAVLNTVCAREGSNEPQGLGEKYVKEFIRYVEGGVDNSLKWVNGIDDVSSFNVMILQSIPFTDSNGKIIVPGRRQSTRRRLSSFSFLKFKKDSMYISLICTVEKKPIIEFKSPKNVLLPVGTLMMENIASIARYYGYSKLTLGSIYSAIGVYFHHGFKTTSEAFNNNYAIYNNALQAYDPTVVVVDEDKKKKSVDNMFESHDNYVNNIISYAPQDEPALIYLERQDREKYTEDIAISIFKIAHEQGKLVAMIDSMFIGKTGTFAANLRHMIHSFANNVSSIYVMGKEGYGEISMFKDI